METIRLPFTDSFRDRVKIFCDGQDLTYTQAVERANQFLSEAEDLSLQSLCSVADIAQLKRALDISLNKYVKEA